MDDNYKLVIRKTYTSGDLLLNAPDEFWVRGKFIDNCRVDLDDMHWSRDIKDAQVFDHEFEKVFQTVFSYTAEGNPFTIELFKSWHNTETIKDGLTDTSAAVTRLFENEPETSNKQPHVHIEYDLNPNKDSDLSKVNLRLDPEKGVRIKWHDCGESVSNFIKADQTGLAKLERMILALEISKKHILKLIANEKS